MPMSFAASRPGSPFVPKPIPDGEVEEMNMGEGNGEADGPSVVVSALEAQASAM
ncbi:hypothetical protein EsDP_00003929 [Epichloe bromicola]|uniref:Uncharacterized protein n=1 Tax=Epichloe bromicola TaxID=79588 RepID=A0ABQ0CQ72_9HYPO